MFFAEDNTKNFRRQKHFAEKGIEKEVNYEGLAEGAAGFSFIYPAWPGDTGLSGDRFFLGHFLDQTFNTGLILTLIFTIFGVAAGFWNAYQLTRRTWDNQDRE